MSRSLYETRALKGFAVQSIANDINMQVISQRGILPVEDHTGIFAINENAESVAPFNFPIEVNENYYIDVRSITNIGRDGILNIRDSINYEFQSNLACLEREWVHNIEKDEFFYLSVYSMRNYVEWMARNIAHEYRLDFVKEMQITAVCALFYVGQHFNNIKEDLTKVQMCRYILKNLKTSQESLDYVMNSQDIEFPRTIEEFTHFLSTCEIDLQLRNFSPLVLCNLLSKTFTFGVVPPNLVLRAAIEHPPVYLCLVNTILSNSYLKKSILGEQLYRGRDGASYLSTFSRIIGRHKDK